MKVLIVNTSDTDGGAARAAYRLHEALTQSGVNSNMLVQFKKSDDPKVIQGSQSKFQKLMTKLFLILDSIPVRFFKNKRPGLFSPSIVGSKKLIKQINKLSPDIVHLHWINNGMIRIKDLHLINAKVVWSLHDMWAFTGGCHYSGGCEKYLEGCGDCPILVSNKKKDLSSIIFKTKHNTYKKKNITVIGLSKWLSELAKSSLLLKGMEHFNLPNPINTDVYKPFDKIKARELWKLPQDKKLILFGAMAATSDPRKGFKELMSALSQIDNPDIELVVFGSNNSELSDQIKLKSHFVGQLSDDVSLVTLYSAADVMAVPSLEENLSNAIMESLACGTPVVAFDVGGNGDMIKHKVNGFLAGCYDSKDMSKGLTWTIENIYKLNMNRKSYEYARSKFSTDTVSNSYINLYNKILGM